MVPPWGLYGNESFCWGRTHFHLRVFYHSMVPCGIIQLCFALDLRRISREGFLGSGILKETVPNMIFPLWTDILIYIEKEMLSNHQMQGRVKSLRTVLLFFSAVSGIMVVMTSRLLVTDPH
ncbi:hypothetical protein BBP40_007010 [Aspergillus hancockii]|nr:hypothetical protein BBP40_007010 [Aspergillus hancockii]